jgi:serine phosphatase RsbU (regulator of sigma subunit)
MSVASFSAEENAMTWLAVGNVEGYIIRADLDTHDRPCILMRSGVVGHSLPPLRADTIHVNQGDTLVMATDGIKSGFATSPNFDACPQIVADNIIKRFARETDDALVVIVRWLGKGK